jgi:hypothetical protein
MAPKRRSFVIRHLTGQSELPFLLSRLRRTARFDVSGLGIHRSDPLPHRLGDKLWATAGSNMLWDAVQDEQVREQIDDVERFEFAVDPDG